MLLKIRNNPLNKCPSVISLLGYRHIVRDLELHPLSGILPEQYVLRFRFVVAAFELCKMGLSCFIKPVKCFSEDECVIFYFLPNIVQKI